MASHRRVRPATCHILWSVYHLRHMTRVYICWSSPACWNVSCFGRMNLESGIVSSRTWPSAAKVSCIRTPAAAGKDGLQWRRNLCAAKRGSGTHLQCASGHAGRSPIPHSLMSRTWPCRLSFTGEEQMSINRNAAGSPSDSKPNTVSQSAVRPQATYPICCNTALLHGGLLRQSKV